MSDPLQAESPQHPPTPQPAASLPKNITQEAIDAAIAHVEKSGNTDGISPDVLQAAYRQIEAQARAKGVNLEPSTPSQGGGSSNYVEAAVMDKKGALDAFHQQRDSLKTAVAQQLQATQTPYRDALQKAHGESPAETGSVGDATMTQLANALRGLDPETIALINAMGMIHANPSLLNNIIWLEIIQTMRNLIDAKT